MTDFELLDGAEVTPRERAARARPQDTTAEVVTPASPSEFTHGLLQIVGINNPTKHELTKSGKGNRSGSRIPELQSRTNQELTPTFTGLKDWVDVFPEW